MSKREMPKVDLTLLKKLVGELQTLLDASQSLPVSEKEEIFTYITELSKASGVAAGVAQEASALVKDIYQITKMAQNPMAGMNEEELLAKILGTDSPTVIYDPDKKNRN